MDTKIIRIDEKNLDERLLREAGEVLRRGGLVAFPTETVYGLGGDALNPESARRIYEAKGRPADNPLIVHISKMEDLLFIAERVPEEAWKIAEAFWPGPLTMILPKSARVPHGTTGGLDTVAVRMPSHPVAAKLIEYGGGFVAAPSANTSGRPSPTLAKYVEEDLRGRIDMIVDGGPVGLGLESTIVDLTVTPPQVLRPGYVTVELLSEILGKVDMDRTVLAADSGQAPRAPGMKYRHYAPRGELAIVDGPADRAAAYINGRAEEVLGRGGRTGVLCTRETAPLYRADSVKILGGRGDGEAVARHLYTALREFDEEGVTQIFSEAFCTEGVGQAVMNRLLKAAGHKVIKI